MDILNGFFVGPGKYLSSCVCVIALKVDILGNRIKLDYCLLKKEGKKKKERYKIKAHLKSDNKINYLWNNVNDNNYFIYIIAIHSSVCIIEMFTNAN